MPNSRLLASATNCPIEWPHLNAIDCRLQVDQDIDKVPSTTQTAKFIRKDLIFTSKKTTLDGAFIVMDCPQV